MATIIDVRLLGAAELARVLGVSRQRVVQLANKPNFPRPVARLTMGAVWELADIEKYAEHTGRILDLSALPPAENDGPDPSPPGT